MSSTILTCFQGLRFITGNGKKKKQEAMAKKKKALPPRHIQQFFYYFDLPKDLQKEIWNHISITRKNILSFLLVSKEMYPHILELANLSKVQVPFIHSAISRGLTTPYKIVTTRKQL
jgi:sarcosine oxidase delta subunit